MVMLLIAHLNVDHSVPHASIYHEFLGEESFIKRVFVFMSQLIGAFRIFYVNNCGKFQKESSSPTCFNLL